MPSTDVLTPRRRDAVVALLALVLLAGPLWIPALHLDDSTYQYERTGVTVTDSGLTYVNASEVPAGTVLSDRIACSGQSSRACAFERHVARGHTVTTEIYSSHPGGRTDPFAVAPDRYDYVQINGTIYEPTTLANRSRVYVVANATVYRKGEAPADLDTSGDLYQNELSLRPVPATEAMTDVSRDLDEVPAPIRRAARTGVGIAHRELTVPQTPIRTAEGTYYRVYLDSQRQPLVDSRWIVTLLGVGTPVTGLVLLNRLRDRVELRHIESTDQDTRRHDE